MDILYDIIFIEMYKRILNYLYRFIKCAKVRECYKRVAFIYRDDKMLELSRVYVFKCRKNRLCTYPIHSGTISH